MSPKVEIVCIGDELLKGSILNTNVSFLSKELFSMGVQVLRQTVLSDEKDLLSQGLKESFQRSDWIICTGGLGSTLDDVTREVVSQVLGLNENFLGEIIFHNTEGLEPGICISRDGKVIILLPGVPQEMKVMAKEKMIPYLKGVLGLKSDFYTQSIHFCLLAESQIDPLLREIQESMPNLTLGI